MRRLVTPFARCAAAVLLAAGLPAHAMYKVIGPDGRVTYTDRAPPGTAAPQQTISLGTTAPAPDTALPPALRQVATRYPVTLYVTEKCGPCDEARQLLRQRGVPYSERQVLDRADLLAFERLSGGREAPTLAVGAQILRGLTASVWHQYLDVAGYPTEALLPPSYRAPAPRPLTERVDAAAAPAAKVDEAAPEATLSPVRPRARTSQAAGTAAPAPAPPVTTIRF